MAILQTKNLSKIFKTSLPGVGFQGRLKSLFSPEYREFGAVKDICLSIEPGEKVAFLGPNGAGKSTSIKMFTGILTPTSGELEVCGLSPSKDRKQLVYKIGAVFGQVSKLYYHLTPLDTFKLFGKMYNIPNKELRTRLDWLICEFEIEDFLNSPVRSLSLGQRMRAETVASLIHLPEILFLDEPTIGLDMIAKAKLRDVINKINAEKNTTVLLTSHDIGDVEEICDRVVIINHGSIVYDGSLTSLRRDHVPFKNITLRLAEDTQIAETSSRRIVSNTGREFSLEIPNTKESLSEELKFLMANYAIEDISVKEPDTESIIRTFY